MSLRLRAAEEGDLDEVFRIYNHEVLHSTATFDTEPVAADGRRAWLATHADARYPALVAVDEQGRVRGWGTLSPWSGRCAYARAAEVSVYVDTSARGRGVGRALVEELAARAPRGGVAVLLARVVAESEVSLGLFASLGFTPIGTMRRVGEKFGRILDVELLERHLDEEGAR